MEFRLQKFTVYNVGKNGIDDFDFHKKTPVDYNTVSK
jgi:hypothetical protein